MIQAKRETWLFRGICLGLLLFYLYIAWQLPYTHDDWDWGLPQGLAQFINASVNSRYAGNLLVVLMTRSPLFKTLFMGLVICLVPLLALGLCRRAMGDAGGALWLLLAANLLLLTMPRVIWQQTFSWVSGFANYVGCIFCMILWHILLLPREKRCRFPALLGRFLFGVVMQLFLENVALFVAGVTLCFTLWRWWREKRIDRGNLALLLGTLVGLGIMFSSPIYQDLFRTGIALGGTRELRVDTKAGFFGKILYCIKAFFGFFPDLWNRNLVLNGAILLLLVLKADQCRLLTGVLNGLMWLGLSLSHLRAELLPPALLQALGLSFFLLVGLELLLFFRQKALRILLLFLWLSAPAIMLPLSLTRMDGYRLLLPSFICQWECALLLMKAVLDTAALKPRQLAGALLGLLLLALCLQRSLVYRDIGATDRQRQALIRSGSLELVLPAWPHGDYLWRADPQTPRRVDYFREFYQVDTRAELRFESGAPFDPWE